MDKDAKYRSVYSGSRLPLPADADLVGVFGMEMVTCENLLTMGWTATLGCPNIQERVDFLKVEILRVEKLRAQQQGNQKPRPYLRDAKQVRH